MKIVNKGVEAVNKALDILNCFTEKREELNLTQLSKITGNYKSTTLRLSRSLENYGYLEKEPNEKYKLGPAINKLILFFIFLLFLFNIYRSFFNIVMYLTKIKCHYS